MSGLLALASCLLAAQARAAGAHWERKPSALLLFGADGAIVVEHDFGAADDAAKTSDAGVSPDKRFAWYFEAAGGARLLRLFGSDGGELWESTAADLPRAGGAPLLFSQDGQLALVSERIPDGWRVVARDYMGNVIMEAGPFAELQAMRLTPDGRFALARWRVPDKSATHTFLDLTRKTRKDIASDSFPLGKARLADDGKVYAGDKVVVDLAAAPEETAGSKKP